jgi:hypothetical protein
VSEPPTPADAVGPAEPGSLEPAPAAAPDPRVEDAVSRLGELEGLPLSEQVSVFADIHGRLEAVLADPESRG